MTAQTQPTFSICIPNFNHGRFIGETIQSVLNQTYPHFEIIVADNASTDESVQVIESFKDERIRLVRNRYNIGFAPNLQRVTMHAQNDFLNLLSSDDQMRPDALETYAQVIRELGPDAERAVLYSQSENFENSGRVITITRKAPDGFYNQHLEPEKIQPHTGPGVPRGIYRGHDVLADNLRRLRTFAPFLSIAYSRKLWEAVEGYNAVRTIGPDKFFNYKLLSLDPVVVYIPRVLYRYRMYVSANRAAQSTTLKQPIDDYLYTLEFSEEFLHNLGLTRRELINTFLDRVCLKEGLSQLGRRKYAHAFKLMAFALASYPGATLRRKRMYLLLPLLMLGPLAKIVAPPLLALYQRTQDRSEQDQGWG